jgi:hypothetical protein
MSYPRDFSVTEYWYNAWLRLAHVLGFSMVGPRAAFDSLHPFEQCYF